MYIFKLVGKNLTIIVREYNNWYLFDNQFFFLLTDIELYLKNKIQLIKTLKHNKITYN